MKYLIKTNIDKVRVTNSEGKNTIYSSKYFKRDKSDLDFMSDFDLQKWYIEEYMGIKLYDEDAPAKVVYKEIRLFLEDNPKLKDRTFLELEYLKGGESILIGTWKISKDYFNQVKEVYKDNPNVKISTSPSKNDEYVINGDLEFLFNLDRSGANYEIIN